MKSSSTESGLRTCVGCRGTAERAVLLRWFAGLDGVPVPDWSGRGARLSGRAAWTHCSASCIRLAVERGGFRRAFGKVPRLVSADLIGSARELGEQVWFRRLGLANRARALGVGQEAARDGMSRVSSGEGLLVLAADAGGSGLSRFRVNAQRKGVAVVSVPTGARLGAGLGRDFVSAVYVEPGAFASTLGPWALGLTGLGSEVVVREDASGPIGSEGAHDGGAATLVADEGTGVGPVGQARTGGASQERACRSV